MPKPSHLGRARLIHFRQRSNRKPPYSNVLMIVEHRIHSPPELEWVPSGKNKDASHIPGNNGKPKAGINTGPTVSKSKAIPQATAYCRESLCPGRSWDIETHGTVTTCFSKSYPQSHLIAVSGFINSHWGHLIDTLNFGPTRD